MQKEATVQELKAALENEASDHSVDFINVCTPEEFAQAHIKGVRNVPLDTLEQHLGEFKDKTRIYVHCRAGRRGAMAVDALKRLGVQAQLYNVEGGLNAWQETGWPIESSPR